MVDRIEFGDRKIGRAEPCFIIAEAGVNHNGSIEMAHQLVDAAVAAGADAVKFQTLKPKTLASRMLRKPIISAGTRIAMNLHSKCSSG